jgi:periplasmic protein TonB
LAYVHPSPPVTLGANAVFARNARTSRVAGIAFVVAMHALLVVAIWHATPAQRVLANAAPVIVRLLSPEPPAPPERRPPPPPPKVAPKSKPADPAPRQTFVPPIEPLVPPAVPTSPITTVTEPPPAMKNEVPAVEIAAPAAPSAPPAPTTPPRFDADYLKNPAPAYPPIARRNGEQGRVLLRVLVAPDGTTQDIVLKTSSGHERLDQAALDTVRQWRFVPARVGREAVAAWVVVPISFSLSR